MNAKMTKNQRIILKKKTKKKLTQVITQAPAAQVLEKQIFQDRPETSKITFKEIETEAILMEMNTDRKNKTVSLTQWKAKDSTWMTMKMDPIKAIRTEIEADAINERRE